MTNAWSIIPLILRASRPKAISDMKALSMPFWIKKGYDGMTFFGNIITHGKEEAEHFNSYWDEMKNHEMIHLYQARSTRNSWWLFYWKYFVFWLKACRYRKHLRNAGYLLNPFEMEAYAHMHDMHYLDDKAGGTTAWRRYAKMSLKERYRLLVGKRR